jgi:hypothetical protein
MIEDDSFLRKEGAGSGLDLPALREAIGERGM